MAGYPSLQNMPGLTETVAECEMSGVLVSRGSGPQGISELVRSYPASNLTSSKQQEMRQAAANTTTDLSTLFLPREGGLSVASEGRSLRTIYRLALTELTDLISSSLSSVLESLHSLRSSFHSSIFPHLKLSPQDLVREFSTTRDFSTAPVKCLAWHPHTTKLAVCFSDDTITIITVAPGQNSLQPVLKHVGMKGVSMMRWRPYCSSQLAVSCQAGVIVWTVDPSSLVSRPSTSCQVRLTRPGHTALTGLEWSPCGRLLASCSPADTRLMVWSVETGQADWVSRARGGGVTLVRWSSDTTNLLTATPGLVFRVWTTDSWQSESWSVGQGGGRVSAAAWAPDSSHLLFASREEPVLYCLRTRGEAGAAIPVMDLSKVCLEDGEVGGGLVQDIQWDPSGHRVAVIFRDSDLVALLRSKPGTARLSPIGWIRGEAGETPVCCQFQQDSPHYGALLSLVWSSGRLQHLPLLFTLREEFTPSQVTVSSPSTSQLFTEQ